MTSFSRNFHRFLESSKMSAKIKTFLIGFPMNYRDFSVKINGKNKSENTIFIFTACKKRSFYEFSPKNLAQKD